nr:hypothetical protein CFP56_60370 [Quercus suber]
MEGPREMNPNQRFVGANSDDSWKNEVEAPVPDQMGASVMNLDYTSEEPLSLTESSDNRGVDDSGSEGHGEGDHGQVDNVARRNKFPVFRPVSNPEHLWFEKELKRSSPGSTILMKTHTFNEGDLALEMDLHTGVSYLERDLFWRAAKAPYAQEFERLMNEIKDVDEGANFWLKGHSTTIWARHMFRSDGLTDTVLNNMCKSFNSRIIKFKGKPIISMLKDIRLYLMNRSQQNRLSILKVESELCPKVYKRLHREKLGSSRWLACWASDTRVSTYKACYEPVIDPINGQNIWTPIGLPPMQPPIKRRSPGRPKKKRAREPNEPSKGHSKGLGISKRCKSCGNIGHNKRSCKGEVGGNYSLPTAASSGPNRRNSRPKQTSNNGHGGRASGLAINEPASIHPTRSTAATTTPVTSSAPSNRPANNSVATSYAAISSAPPNTSTSKMRKGSITSDTLNASRNASRYREVLSANSSQASVHGPRGSASGI